MDRSLAARAIFFVLLILLCTLCLRSSAADETAAPVTMRAGEIKLTGPILWVQADHRGFRMAVTNVKATGSKSVMISVARVKDIAIATTSTVYGVTGSTGPTELRLHDLVTV